MAGEIPTQYSSSGLGWVSASYVITQNTSSVPVVAAPPAPPPVETTPPPPTGATGCVLVSQSPTDYTQFTAGSGFSTTWVLQNTGSAAWEQSVSDIRYVSAVDNMHLHQGSDIYDLVADVQPGATYNFTVSMIAPFDAGTYGELWELSVGGGVICQFYVYIEVPTSGDEAPAPTSPPAPTNTLTGPTSTLPAPTKTPAAPTNTPAAPTTPASTATKPPPTPTTPPPAATKPPPTPTTLPPTATKLPPTPTKLPTPTLLPTAGPK